MSDLTNTIEHYLADLKFLNKGRELRTSKSNELLEKALKELYRVNSELREVSHDRGTRALENDKLRLDKGLAELRIEQLSEQIKSAERYIEELERPLLKDQS